MKIADIRCGGYLYQKSKVITNSQDEAPAAPYQK